MAPEPFTDTELEAGAKAVAAIYRVKPGGPDTDIARAVLSAAAPLIVARVRAEVAEEIAEGIADNPGPDPSPAIPAWWSGWMESRDAAAAIARAHRTTPTDPTEEDHDA